MTADSTVISTGPTFVVDARYESVIVRPFYECEFAISQVHDSFDPPAAVSCSDDSPVTHKLLDPIKSEQQTNHFFNICQPLFKVASMPRQQHRPYRRQFQETCARSAFRSTVESFFLEADGWRKAGMTTSVRGVQPTSAH